MWCSGLSAATRIFGSGLLWAPAADRAFFTVNCESKRCSSM